jgi:hypothetical protein
MATDSSGLGQCFYYIRSGQMDCYSDLPGLPGFSGTFASGNNGVDGCKNNPDCIADKGAGPIPTGSWYWDQNAWTGKRNGRVLVPVEIDASNREDIRTHSCDNPFTNSKPYCSAGCVTGNVPTVQRLNNFLQQQWNNNLSNTLEVFE